MPEERYKLSDTVHEKVFRRLLKKVLAESEPHEHPHIVILGGQPGSGKSRLTEIAKANIFDHQPVTVINGDDYRTAHPEAEEIYRRHDKAFAEMTDPDVRLWTPKLLDAAVRARRNIVFEATMRNREPLMTTIKWLKKEGYIIDVMVMAVNKKVSGAGILKRYANQKAKGGIARWTPPEIHNIAYRDFPKTVGAIECESPIDSISIYNRAGELLYRGERVSATGYNAKTAILSERERPLTKSEMENLQKDIEDIREKMAGRGALEEFASLFDQI